MDTYKQQIKDKFRRTDYSGDIGGFVWELKNSTGEDYELDNFIDFIQKLMMYPELSEDEVKKINEENDLKYWANHKDECAGCAKCEP